MCKCHVSGLKKFFRSQKDMPGKTKASVDSFMDPEEMDVGWWIQYSIFLNIITWKNMKQLYMYNIFFEHDDMNVVVALVICVYQCLVYFGGKWKWLWSSSVEYMHGNSAEYTAKAMRKSTEV